MSRFTDEERVEIRSLFRRLADIQANIAIKQLEADASATLEIRFPNVKQAAGDE